MLCELVAVVKKYPVPGNDTLNAIMVLDNISLSIAPGESVAITGPSGSGKTTLLNIASTLDRPSQGSVIIDGSSVNDLDAAQLAAVRNRKIGIVFQRHNLLPQCTLLENVLLPTIPQRTTTSDLKDLVDRARSLLERVGLGQRHLHRPQELSGGECQRAALVRALINGPLLLCADEPTGSLDRVSARSLGELLVEINREAATALLVVTHSEQLASCMDRQLHLADGRLS
jgi:lipoprotein-releasing system ATP-binding protein